MQIFAQTFGLLGEGSPQIKLAAALIPIIGGVVAPLISFFIGGGQVARRMKLLDLQARRLEIIEHALKLKGAYAEACVQDPSLPEVDFDGIVRATEVLQEDRTPPGPPFERIARRPLLQRYLIVPKPRGPFGWLVTIAYYYALYSAVVLVFFAVDEIVAEPEQAADAVLGYVVVQVALVLLTAALRRWLFKLRRRHEARHPTPAAPAATPPALVPA